MTFEEVLDQALSMLHRRQRVTYQTLKLQFGLDQERLEALKDALLFAHTEISDEDDRGLVWTGDIPDPAQNPRSDTDRETRFQTVLLAVMGLLQREIRVTYRELKYMLAIDDDLLSKIREELLLKHAAIDEEGKVLIWASDAQPLLSPVVAPTNTPTDGLSAPPDISRTEMMPGQLAASSESVPSVTEAERRQLTVMFCDLEGSTDLSGRLDPEDLREVVRAYQETAAEVVERYEGHIAQYLGDGLLIYFGFPAAHEDDAHRAVHTGLGIVEAMDTLNIRLADHYGVELAVRIGIHTGLVVVGEMGGGERQENLALGETPNIAARLEGLASPNAVVVSPVTARLVQRAFVLEELGAQTLKGLSEPMVIVRVIGAVKPESTGPAMKGFGALVGRDEEIGLLLRRWAQSKEGQGQVILLSGEAGIGKSSLVNGLQDRARQEGLARVTLRCSPYHTSSAFYPIIDRLQRTLGWKPDDPEDTKLTKLERALEATNLALVETVPLMASFLSLKLPEGRYPELTLSPQQLRQQTQDTLVAWLQETAEHQPVLAIWEDLHWADPSTLELLGLFVDQAPTVSMLHLMTFRPEFEPPWPTRSHMTPITVNRLERSQVEALITHMADNKTLPVEVVAHIVAKTDGVPLYVEELTKMLLQSNLLQSEPDQYVLTGPLTTVAIPDTLQDSLMARLDQMKTAKEAAQFGAVLGRDFAYEMIEAISSQDKTTLQEGLAQLVAAELLYQRGRPPRARFIFKHALIQDVAYASLLKSTRQQVHQRITQVLETQFPELMDNQPDLLAHHALRGEVWDKALAYYQQAGQKMMTRSAHREAAGYFQQAIDTLSHLPEQRDTLEQAIDLRLALRSAMHPSGDYERILPLLKETEALAETLDDPGRLGHVIRHLSNHFYIMGEYDRALAVGQRALALATTSGEAIQPALIHNFNTLIYYSQGNYRRAIEGYRDIVVILDGVERHELYGQIYHPAMSYRARLAVCHAELGAFAEGNALGEKGLQMAEAEGQPMGLMYASWWLGMLSLHQGNLEKALALLQKAMVLCQESSLSLYFPWVAANLGTTYALSGCVTDALPLLTQALEQATAMNMTCMQVLCRLPLGATHLLAGRLDEAQALAEEALRLTHVHQERGHEAYALKLLGNIALHDKSPDFGQAKTHYQQALALAIELGMRPLQAHCHRGLGTFYSQTGQAEQARAELSTAIEMYQEMGMVFWLPEAEAELAAVEGR